MTGYCPDCGNALCNCPPVELDEEPFEDFLMRLKEVAEDWRYSDEFIGIMVRNRYPRSYE